MEGEEADVQAELNNHGGKRIMLHYKNIGEAQSVIDFYIGERDKIVQSIVIYPKQAFSKESFTAQYGNDFVGLNSDERICQSTE